MKRFTLIVSVLCVVYALAAWFGAGALGYAQNQWLFPVSVVFQAVIHILSFWIAKRSLEKKPEMFVGMVSAATLVKMLASFIFVLIVLLSLEFDKLWFVASFFTAYFSFVAFEVYLLLANLRRENTP